MNISGDICWNTGQSLVVSLVCDVFLGAQAATNVGNKNQS